MYINDFLPEMEGVHIIGIIVRSNTQNWLW